MKLMIRADDLGYSLGVNYGIYESVKNGMIRNIGFMVNMEHSVEGYELVKDLPIVLGQHTNICVGKPISDPKHIPSLCDDNGSFKSSKTYRKALNDFVVFEEAVIEVEAQYEMFKKITGKEPMYFEGHAVNSVNFCKALEFVANKHNLRYVPFSQNEHIEMHMDSMNPNYDPLELVKKVSMIDDDKYHMIVFHPGFLDAYILETSSLTTPRVVEVKMLCGDELKAYLEHNSIHLYTFDEVEKW